MSRRACHLTMMDKNSLCKWNNMVDRVGKILQHFVQSGPAELAARRVARIPDEVGDRVRQLSMRQQLLRLIPATLAILALSACASSEYMGISLRPGGAAAELQDLARRAQAGDRAAQFELADRFEHGQGVTQDLYSASRLRNAHKVISRSVWIYSPNFGVGSQPNVAAVDVPSNVPAYSSKSSDSVGAMTNPSSLISSKSFTVHLEIEAIVDVIADYIRIKDKRKISPHDLIVDIVKAGQKANLTTEDVISQEILFIKKECKNSEFYSDDLKNIFHRYVCNDKNSKFIVLNISDHNSSKLFSNGIISRETFLRYLDRRDNFTVEKMKKTLIGVGFDYLETIRLSQAYPHLPVPPDAQSLFVHRSGVPLITVQHPVDHGQIKNKDRSLPVPAVQRLSLFFPAGE